MPFDILNILQKLLLPLVAVAVALIGLLVWLGGRKSKPKPPPRPLQAPTPPAAAARTARPSAAAEPTAEPTAESTAGPAAKAPPAAGAPLPTALDRAPGPAPRRPPQAAPVPAALPAGVPIHAPTVPVAVQRVEPTVAASALPPVTPPTAPPAAPGARPRMADLLLVDDSAVVRARLRRLFEPAGYTVVLAQDGEEALGLLTQGRYGVLVTDLEMPRLDGVGLIRAAMADPACAEMPMLAITGHDDLQAKLNELQAVAGIYRKPWVDDELLGHVRHLVAPSLMEADEP